MNYILDNKITLVCPRCLHEGVPTKGNCSENHAAKCRECGHKINTITRVEAHYCQLPEMLVREYLESRGYCGNPNSWTEIAAVFQLKMTNATEYDKVKNRWKQKKEKRMIGAFEIIDAFWGKDVIE